MVQDNGNEGEILVKHVFIGCPKMLKVFESPVQFFPEKKIRDGTV